MKKNIKLTMLFLVLILVFVMSGCSGKDDESDKKNTENTANTTDNTTNITDNSTNTTDNTVTPDSGNKDINNDIINNENSEDEYSLILGNYYDDEDPRYYIAITEGLNYEMYGLCDDYIGVIDYGYLEKKDDSGFYTAYPELYVDEEPFEIFEFDTGVLSWNGSMYYYSEEAPEVSDAEEYSLPVGRYYNDEDPEYYIDITEDLNYELCGPCDGYIGVIDCGYLEKTDDSGFYTAYPELYVDEEPFEIFEFDTGVLSWNGSMYYYSEEGPVANETAYTILPGVYYCISEDNCYIVVSDDLMYESYGTSEWSDEVELYDEGYFEETDQTGLYLMNSTWFDLSDPAEVYVDENGLLDCGLVYEHGSDPAEIFQ